MLGGDRKDARKLGVWGWGAWKLGSGTYGGAEINDIENYLHVREEERGWDERLSVISIIRF